MATINDWFQNLPQGIPPAEFTQQELLRIIAYLLNQGLSSDPNTGGMMIEGVTGVNQTATGNPVHVAGVDINNVVRELRVSPTGAVQISSGSSDDGKTGDDLVCSVAGTPVNAPAYATVNGVMLVARSTNVGNVYIGVDNTVSNMSGSKRGLILSQLGMPSAILPVSNLNKIWLNADNAGDGVGVLVL